MNLHTEFLADSKGMPLYRGFKDSIIDVNYIFTPRKDRKPLSMSEQDHRDIDHWFLKNFGYRFRSQTIFATGDPSIAKNYGQVRVIKPLSEYSFCWSPICKDLKNEVDKKPSNENIHEMLRRLRYQSTDLASAIESKNEIMIFCEKISASLD